jgi:acyl carrier protein
VSRLWAKYCPDSRSGDLNENFFDAGGESLTAMRLVFEISTSFGAPISLNKFMSDPTLNGLLSMLIQRPDDATGSVPE